MECFDAAEPASMNQGMIGIKLKETAIVNTGWALDALVHLALEALRKAVYQVYVHRLILVRIIHAVEAWA
jgi:hypothetical protein